MTRVEDVSGQDAISRELALIRVKADSATRSEVMQIVDIFRARIVHVDMDSVIIQAVGKENQVDSLIQLLSNFGILEMTRTGRVAMVRGDGVAVDTAVSANGNQ
ncbi:MAG TPA: acetolactate synthase small subunit [Anaerolineae bacterium]|nr:acetolactate synthase small subunit [Anaerolineae bacterium]